MYCRIEIGPQFLNGQRVNAKDPATGRHRWWGPSRSMVARIRSRPTRWR